MPNEVQEALGAAAYRMVMHQPHIVYGIQYDRFAWVVPPNPIHADCSGSVGHVYWDGIRVRIGGDTGAIARDVAAGKASWVHITEVQNGDLVMRRSGSVYNGGSDEHVGMFLYRLSDGRPVTFESAGSRNGVGYYPRALNFWRDGVRYHDLGNPPAPKPPAPVEDEEDMRGYIAQTDEAGIPGQQWWLLLPSGVRQKCLSEAHRDWMASTEMLVKLPNGTADKAVRKLPASYLYQWTYRP